MDDHYLEEIARGQQERTVKDISAKNYLSRVKTLSKIMWRNPGIRTEALVLDDEGNPSYYTGQAHLIMAMKDPFTVGAATRLFAAVSVDAQLPQKRNRTALAQVEEVVNEVDDTIPEHLQAEASSEEHCNPSRRIATVCAQSYVNFKSALKWCVECDRPAWNKRRSVWSSELDKAVQLQIKGYKKDIGEKKRLRIMKHKEGKTKYSLAGYIHICEYFHSLKPCHQQNTWKEGLFGALFTKISVNTIARSSYDSGLLVQAMLVYIR